MSNRSLMVLSGVTGVVWLWLIFQWPLMRNAIAPQMSTQPLVLVSTSMLVVAFCYIGARWLHRTILD